MKDETLNELKDYICEQEGDIAVKVSTLCNIYSELMAIKAERKSI